VLLSDEEQEAVKAEALAFHEVPIELTPHPTLDVLAKTLRGERTYYLAPDASTAEHYAVMVAALKAHPELTLLCRLTLKSALSMFALRVFGDVLVLEQLVWPADLHTARFVPTAYREGVLPLAEQLLAQLTAPFDPAAYRDTAGDKLAELVAAKDPTAAAADATVTALPGAGTDLLAQPAAAVM
jgi:DNA end-binding protein Ku